jgi:DNA-binding MarR family transcriptional regulator
MSAVDEMVCFSLYAATRATTQAYRSLLEPWGLTYPQYLVLVLLWDRDERSVRELGEHLELDSGTLSPLLRRMEQAGFLVRTRGQRDERVVIASLTDRGRALKADLAHVPACIAAGAGLTLEQARELIGTLNRFAAGMHGAASQSRAAASPAAAVNER